MSLLYFLLPPPAILHMYIVDKMAKIGPSFRAPALKINLPSGDDHRRRRPHPKVEEGDDDDDDYHLTFQYLRRPKRFSECQVTFIREGRPKANKWDLFCSRQLPIGTFTMFLN